MSAGQLFNERYELGLSIGQTGLANAYRAHDRLLDRPVVFQSLLSRHTTDREFVQRFRHQVQAAANLTHPAIVTVLDWGRDPQGIGDQPGPTYFMVTEQVDGRTLVDLVEKEGPVSGATTVRIMIEITSALGYAHRGGVMHGALQPSDIHLTHNGSVRVGDVGLNGALGTAWRPDPDAVEIARWRAPELVLGQDADERTDVYGLGAVGYFALTGKAPFEGTTADEVAEGHLRVIPPAPSKLRAGVPRGLEVIMGRSLAKQRNDRFATMNDLRAALIRFRETLEPRPVETGAPVRSAGAVTPTLAGSTLAGPTSSADPTTGSAASSFDTGEVVPAAASAGSPGPVSPGPQVPSDQAQPRRDRPRRDPTRRDAAGRGGRPDPRAETVQREAVGRASVPVAPVTPEVRRAPPDPRRARAAALAPGDDAAGPRPADPRVRRIAPRSRSRGPADGADATRIDSAGTRPPRPRIDRAPRPPVPEPRRRGGGLPFVLVLIALLAILSVLVVALAKTIGYGGEGGPKVELPNLNLTKVTEATTRLVDLGLVARVVREPSESVPVDVVIDHEPTGGAKVPRGAEVVLRVSDGPLVIAVPDVIGQTRDAAIGVLAASGYGYDIVEVEAPDGTAAQTVLQQEPPPATQADRSVKVKLTVATQSGKAKVPDMAGKSAQDAQIDLQTRGFRTTTDVEASLDVASGLVTRTDPLAGSTLEKGAAIVIFLSAGPTAPVPNVIGRTEADARALLASKGFAVVRSTRRSDDPAQDGVVVAQTPGADSGLESGGTVSIRVAEFSSGGAGGSVTTVRKRKSRVTTTLIEDPTPPEPGVSDPAAMQTIPNPEVTQPPTTAAPEPVATVAPDPAVPATTVA